MARHSLRLNLTITSQEIECLPGQITILKCRNLSIRDQIRRALSGTSESAELKLDFGSSIPSIMRLGFDEIQTDPENNVIQVLLNAGIPEVSIEGLTTLFGLRTAVFKKYVELTPDEKRRIEILIATKMGSGVLFLAEPFEAVAESWRDQIAQSITAYVSGKQAIAVVVESDFRPESWIKNAIVTEYLFGANWSESVQQTKGDAALEDDQKAEEGTLNELASRVLTSDAEVKEIVQVDYDLKIGKKQEASNSESNQKKSQDYSPYMPWVVAALVAFLVVLSVNSFPALSRLVDKLAGVVDEGYEKRQELRLAAKNSKRSEQSLPTNLIDLTEKLKGNEPDEELAEVDSGFKPKLAVDEPKIQKNLAVEVATGLKALVNRTGQSPENGLTPVPGSDVRVQTESSPESSDSGPAQADPIREVSELNEPVATDPEVVTPGPILPVRIPGFHQVHKVLDVEALGPYLSPLTLSVCPDLWPDLTRDCILVSRLGRGMVQKSISNNE